MTPCYSFDCFATLSQGGLGNHDEALPTSSEVITQSEDEGSSKLSAADLLRNTGAKVNFVQAQAVEAGSVCTGLVVSESNLQSPSNASSQERSQGGGVEQQQSTKRSILSRGMACHRRVGIVAALLERRGPKQKLRRPSLRVNMERIPPILRATSMKNMISEPGSAPGELYEMQALRMRASVRNGRSTRVSPLNPPWT